MAYAVYNGLNGYFKDGLNLPAKTVVEIPDDRVNEAKSIRGVLIVTIQKKEELKGVKIEENIVAEATPIDILPEEPKDDTIRGSEGPDRGSL